MVAEKKGSFQPQRWQEDGQWGEKEEFQPQKWREEKFLPLEVRVEIGEIPAFGCVTPDH